MTGIVYLVGAGPGDEGLITVKGLQRIKEADIVVYDYLSNTRLLKNCKPTCVKIYVGKKAGHHTLKQDEINLLLIEKAKEGKKVVRLKGGDPYTFGRGGEEGELLRENGIMFEVVPGVTSAIGGLAYAGIPVTYRGLANSFYVITGHLANEQEDINYNALATLKGTLIFLMGISHLHDITSRLMEAGKSPYTPSAIVFSASTPNQEVISGNLSNIVDLMGDPIDKPGIIVIGDVVEKREVLDFYTQKPLFGKKLVVTRSTAQNSTIVERINELGGHAIEMPTIVIKPLDKTILLEKIENITTYNHLIFTSQNSVQIFLNALLESGRDVRRLAHLKITVIGRMTEKALNNYGLKPDYVADEYQSEGIIDILKNNLNANDKVLIPRSKNAKRELVDALALNVQVDELFIYETKPELIDKSFALENLKKLDVILFTSASTVENFMEQMNKLGISLEESTKIASIGPITSQRIIDYGLKVHVEALEHTIDGMLEALIKDMSN